MADDTAILNLSDPKVKQMVIAHIRQASGLHRFMLRRCRAQRSLQQNAYLWGVVYKAVQAGIEEAWGERYSVEWIHLFLKKRFLTEPVVNRHTGEVVDEAIGSTAQLDKAEFAAYLDNIIKFAAEYLGVDIPPADPNYSHAA